MCCRGGGGSSGGSGSSRRLRCVVCHGADELVPATAHRPDEALRFAVVAECPPGRLDPAGQGRLADEPSTPYRVEQLFLGDAALAVADQLGQDVEHLRLDADHLVTVAQFVALGVEDESVEAPQAGGPLSPAVGRLGRAHQSVAQFSQLCGSGAFVDRRRHVLCGAPHLVDAVGQLRLPPRRSAPPNPGTARCPSPGRAARRRAAGRTACSTVGAAQPCVVDVTTTPSAGLRSGAPSGDGLHGT